MCSPYIFFFYFLFPCPSLYRIHCGALLLLLRCSTTRNRIKSIISTELRVIKMTRRTRMKNDATLPSHSMRCIPQRMPRVGKKGLRWSNKGRDGIEMRWIHQNRASLQRKGKKREGVKKRKGRKARMKKRKKKKRYPPLLPRMTFPRVQILC